MCLCTAASHVPGLPDALTLSPFCGGFGSLEEPMLNHCDTYWCLMNLKSVITFLYLQSHEGKSKEELKCIGEMACTFTGATCLRTLRWQILIPLKCACILCQQVQKLGMSTKTHSKNALQSIFIIKRVETTFMWKNRKLFSQWYRHIQDYHATIKSDTVEL